MGNHHFGPLSANSTTVNHSVLTVNPPHPSWIPMNSSSTTTGRTGRGFYLCTKFAGCQMPLRSAGRLVARQMAGIYWLYSYKLILVAKEKLNFLLTNHWILKMRCSPESVDTTSDNSLTFRAKAASSKAFCILETWRIMARCLWCAYRKNPRS